MQTITDLLANWLFQQKTTRSRKHYEWCQYQSDIITDCIAELKLPANAGAWEPIHVMTLLEHLKNKAGKHQLRPSTIKGAWRALCLVLDLAVKAQLTKYNPARQVPRPRGQSRPTERYDLAELEKLFGAIDLAHPIGLRDGAWLAIAAELGLRAEEISTLNLSDWHGDRLVVQGKGDKQRTVGVTPFLQNVLEAYLKIRPTFSPKGNWLFVSKDGDQLSYAAMRARLMLYAAKAGISDAAMHRFRVTFASEFWLQCESEIGLQMALGHAWLDMTRKYIRQTEEEKAAQTSAKTVSVLNKVLPAAHPSAAPAQPASPAEPAKSSLADADLATILEAFKKHFRNN